MKCIIRNYNQLVDLFKKLKPKVEKEPFIIDCESAKHYKTQAQNKTFHQLLDKFWESGYSSFLTYEDLRNYYKRIAGLITLKKVVDLSENTKNVMLKSIELLPINQDEKIVLKKLLKGVVEVQKSWADVSKEKATFTLNQLINDIMESGAYAGYKPLQDIVDNLHETDNYFS